MRERRSEFEAEPGSRIGYAGIVRREIGVRHVVEKARDADRRGQLIAELDALAEQTPSSRASCGRAGRCRGYPSCRAPPRLPLRKTPSPHAEQVLDQRDPPGQAEIAGIGLARGVERAADMRARRADERRGNRAG